MPTDRFTLKILERQEHGFRLEISAGEESLTLSAQIDPTTFSEMVLRTNLLMQGMQPVSFFWHAAPETHEFRLTRQDAQIVVEIYDDDWYYPPRPRPVFRAECSAGRWLRQVKQLLSLLLYELGEEGYEAFARSAFPHEQMKILDGFIEML